MFTMNDYQRHLLAQQQYNSYIQYRAGGENRKEIKEILTILQKVNPDIANNLKEVEFSQRIKDLQKACEEYQAQCDEKWEEKRSLEREIDRLKVQKEELEKAVNLKPFWRKVLFK